MTRGEIDALIGEAASVMSVAGEYPDDPRSRVPTGLCAALLDAVQSLKADVERLTREREDALTERERWVSPLRAIVPQMYVYCENVIPDRFAEWLERMGFTRVSEVRERCFYRLGKPETNQRAMTPMLPRLQRVASAGESEVGCHRCLRVTRNLVWMQARAEIYDAYFCLRCACAIGKAAAKKGRR